MDTETRSSLNSTSFLYTIRPMHLSDEPFFFIINIQAQDYNIVKSALNLSQLKHSVYIDTIDVFKQNNPQLPDSRIYHTFLLNKENKVVLIGNPLYNEHVEKLFLELLKEQ